MGEISFARKYRPRTFRDYMGSSIKTQLENRFKDERLYPQTVLLWGERGCGKTTAARLMCKEYLCYNKIDGAACGVCESCVEIDERLIMADAGINDVNCVQELDLASEGGKASIDDAIDEAMLEPMAPDKYKIVILDECHMATPAAQNRLLKIAEEPPKHLILIFCTTDPDKMLSTLRARCTLQLHVKKATEEDLLARLKFGCEKEGIKTSNEALKIITKKAYRNPRECWNLLEQVAKGANYEVTLDTVAKALGGADTKIYLEYMRAGNSDLGSILRFSKRIHDEDIEPRSFINGLTRFILDCNNIKYGIALEDYPLEFVKQVKEVYKTYNSEDLDQLLQIIEYANTQLNTAGTSNEYADLIITTTAMRIGKIKLLSQGLQNEAQRALIETQKGNVLAIEKNTEELKHIPIIKDVVGDALMQTVFGNKVKEITSGASMNIIDEDDSVGDDASDLVSDDELMKLLSSYAD